MIRPGIVASALAVASVPALAACGGGMTELQSRPLDGPISIDASQSEWWGVLADIGSDLTAGFRNDADYLYLTLTTDDEDLVKIKKSCKYYKSKNAS